MFFKPLKYGDQATWSNEM